MTVEAPFFSFERPFDSDNDVRPSRYYPYGTDAGGQYLLHHGVDIGNPTGTPVLAVADGEVVFAGRDDKLTWGPTIDFYGQLVVIQHDESIEGHNLTSLYGHVSRVLVEQGDTVVAGQPIAEVGAEGIALGPHLHLEIRTSTNDYDSTMNPELMIQMLPGHGVIVGRLVDNQGGHLAGQPISLFVAEGAKAGAWQTQTTTYPDRFVDGAPGSGESFLFGDTPSGSYWVSTQVDGARASVPVTVRDGSASVVTLIVDTRDEPKAQPSSTPTATLPRGSDRPN